MSDWDDTREGRTAQTGVTFQRPAIVDVKQKKGHVVLMGINVQDRHWTFGTFKLLFNAIQAAGMLPLEQVRNIRRQILN